MSLDEEIRPAFLRTSTNEPFDPLGLKVRRRCDGVAAVATLACAATFDWAVQYGFNGLAGVALFAVLPAALASSGRIRGRQALVALALIPAFGVWLGLRTSPWLVPLDVLAAILLVAVACSFSSGGSMFRVTVPNVVMRALALIVHGIAAPAFLTQPVRGLRLGGLRRVAPVLRGVLLITPAVILLGALLSSADSVFASLFQFDVSLGKLPIHIALLVIGSWLVSGLLRAASSREPQPPVTVTWRLGTLEALVGLGSVVALYFLFVVTQVVVWLGGARHVLETKGLTYAEHARQGFFQLLAVSVITLLLLTTLRASVGLRSRPQRYWWVGLSEAAIVLTLVIVGLALHRLFMYEDAYGLTMLRLYSTVFAVWIGVLFVMLGYSMAQDDSGRHWFIGTALALGLAGLFILNVVNPERLVVERNASRVSSPVAFDSNYVASLSDDALPALRSSLTHVADATREQLTRDICGTTPRRPAHGWTEANLARSKAIDARRSLCGM